MKTTIAAIAMVGLGSGAAFGSEAQTLMRKIVEIEAVSSLQTLGAVCPFYDEGSLYFAGITELLASPEQSEDYSQQAVLSARVFDNAGPELQRVLDLTCHAMFIRIGGEDGG